MEKVEKIIMELAGNPVVRAVFTLIVMDTIFGVGRAIKEKHFNSCIGIDGAIRKIAMLVSLICLGVLDKIMSINLIGFIPEEVRGYLPASMQEIGMASFFGLLYLCYEMVSVLKNMSLCGLPVKRIWVTVQKVLGKYTDELPDTEEQDELQEMNRRMEEKKHE